MVQTKIEEKEKSEHPSEEVPQDTTVDQDAAQDAQEVLEDKVPVEIPLDQMDKAALIEKVKSTQADSDRNYELYLRAHAEMENLKKRFQRDKTELIKYSNESLTRQLLTVIDNLEKAIDAVGKENPLDAVKEGIELILKGLIDILQRSGLSEVPAKGQPFDPNFHEAITEQEDNAVTPGTVIHVLQKGYTLNDRLIRPAMVIVSKTSKG